MPQALKQKPRLGDPKQPTPERWVYVEAARKKAAHPTRGAAQLSDEEVQAIRVLVRNGAVPFTVAAQFGISRREVRLMCQLPIRLRADVPRHFESPGQAQDREGWLKAEVGAAWREAETFEAMQAWSEAKRENRRIDRERRVARP
jgi:hypothetical protein